MDARLSHVVRVLNYNDACGMCKDRLKLKFYLCGPDMALSPLLVDAKKEYTAQLADLLSPYVLNTIARLYDSSRKSTKAFRELLRQVPNWNASQIDDRTNEIERRNPQLQDLIAACCVSYTKVLGSIRLNQSQQSNVRISLPQSTAFVHSVYVDVAKSFFYDPKLVYADRRAKTTLMRDAVDESIRQHVPIDQLLKAYLHVAVDDAGIDPMAASFNDQPSQMQSQSQMPQSQQQRDESPPPEDESPPRSPTPQPLAIPVRMPMQTMPAAPEHEFSRPQSPQIAQYAQPSLPSQAHVPPAPAPQPQHHASPRPEFFAQDEFA